MQASHTIGVGPSRTSLSLTRRSLLKPYSVTDHRLKTTGVQPVDEWHLILEILEERDVKFKYFFK